MNPTIIEKAAKAKFYRAHPDAAEGTWGATTEPYRQMFRDSVTRTLTPVYADIQAEALREAARNPIPRDALGGSTRAWLRIRADELDGGTK